METGLNAMYVFGKSVDGNRRLRFEVFDKRRRPINVFDINASVFLTEYGHHLSVTQKASIIDF